jgi:hypothetical protein
MPVPIFTSAENQAGSESRCRNETAQSDLEMKQRNPTWGCPQIADQINLAFGTSIPKDVVRRIFALHYRPEPGADGSVMAKFPGAWPRTVCVARLIPL